MTLMLSLGFLLALCSMTPTIAHAAFLSAPPAQHHQASSSSSSLHMAPKFDKTTQRWIPSSPQESAQAGYDILGSLLRQGPQPVFQRLFKADEYDQAVLKLMAGDGISDRNVAQAEMDAYLRNPSDWAYNRVKGYQIDYLKIDAKQIVLTVIWSVLVVSIVGRGIYSVQTGENFWAILGLTSKVAECVDYNACIFPPQ